MNQGQYRITSSGDANSIRINEFFLDEYIIPNPMDISLSYLKR